MDSLTHLAVGALTPFAFKNAPRLGVVALFGIVAGELPDLDILAGVSAEAILAVHRGPTHSLPAILLFSLLLAVLFKLILLRLSFRQPTVRLSIPEDQGESEGDREEGGGRNRQGGRGCLAVLNRPGDWPLREIWLAALLALALHVYLDCMTTFGTQAFWPFSHYRVALPALFIIDPLLTLPLLGVMCCCLLRLRKPDKHLASLVWARRALIFALVYPLFCLGVQAASSWALNFSLADEADGPEKIVLTPMPLSPIYWKAVAVSENEYHLARSGPLDLLPGRTPAFGRPYTRVKPEEWRALQKALPVFRAYAKFVSFPILREAGAFPAGPASGPPPGLREITFEDLRYVPTGPEDLSNLGGRGQGMFLMQARIRERGGLLTAWRYLGRAEDAAVTPWVELDPPVRLF